MHSCRVFATNRRTRAERFDEAVAWKIMTDHDNNVFEGWRLTFDDADLNILSVSSFGVCVATNSESVADAAEARAVLPLTLAVASGKAFTFELSVTNLGWTADGAQFFELAAKDKGAFRAFFCDEVLSSVLASRHLEPGAPTATFRWCFAGLFGEIADLDPESSSFRAIDPTGAFGRFVRNYEAPACVDVLLGNEHLTCVPAFLIASTRSVRVSARTSEVGRPINFAALTRWIAAHREIGTDVPRWWEEIRRAFPNS